MAVIKFSDGVLTEYMPSLEEGLLDIELHKYNSSFGDAYVETTVQKADLDETSKHLDVETLLKPIFEERMEPYFLIRRESTSPINNNDIIFRRDIAPFPEGMFKNIQIPLHDPSALRTFFNKYVYENSRNGYEIIIKPHGAAIVNQSAMIDRHYENGLYITSQKIFPEEDLGIYLDNELGLENVPQYKDGDFILLVQDWKLFNKNKLVNFLEKGGNWNIMSYDAEEYWISSNDDDNLFERDIHDLSLEVLKFLNQQSSLKHRVKISKK